MQYLGCHALVLMDSPANRTTIAPAGGVERVTVAMAMARFPADKWVQASCQAAVDAMLSVGPPSICWTLVRILLRLHSCWLRLRRRLLRRDEPGRDAALLCARGAGGLHG